jgi:hypothetical protein
MRPHDVWQQLLGTFADLHRFEVLSDSLGHNFGDHALVSAAMRLRGCRVVKACWGASAEMGVRRRTYLSITDRLGIHMASLDDIGLTTRVDVRSSATSNAAGQSIRRKQLPCAVAVRRKPNAMSA